MLLLVLWCLSFNWWLAGKLPAANSAGPVHKSFIKREHVKQPSNVGHIRKVTNQEDAAGALEGWGRLLEQSPNAVYRVLEASHKVQCGGGDKTGSREGGEAARVTAQSAGSAKEDGSSMEDRWAQLSWHD